MTVCMLCLFSCFCRRGACSCPPPRDMPRHAATYFAILCFAMIRYAIPRYTTQYHTMPRHATPRHCTGATRRKVALHRPRVAGAIPSKLHGVYYLVLHYYILYYTILYHTIPYHTIPYYPILGSLARSPANSTEYVVLYYITIYYLVSLYLALHRPRVAPWSERAGEQIGEDRLWVKPCNKFGRESN